MIDVHCHILPNIPGDDGASNLSDAIAMGRLLSSAGFTAVIATPHCIEGEAVQAYDLMGEQVAQLNGALKDEAIPLTIHLGCEILYHNEILSRLRSGRAIPLGDSHYVLIELPMRTFPEEVPDLVSELVLAGYYPIIAHPERNRVLSAEPHRLKELIEKGAYAQLNLCSLTNMHGQTAKRTAEKLLEAQLYQLVGSDLHSPNLNIKAALEQLKKNGSATYIHEITTINGQRVLADEAIPHKKEIKMPTPVIKVSQVKEKDKRRSIGKIIIVSVAAIAMVASGVLAFADRLIQKELETAFADAGINLEEELSLYNQSGNANTAGAGEDKSTSEQPSSTDSNTGAANAQSATGTASTANNSGTISGSGGSEGTNGAEGQKGGGSKADTSVNTASESLKQLTLAEKAHAYSIVMGKLTPEIISRLKGLSANGFTSEEKQEVKQIFYTNFTAEEQQFLMSLYKKGK